MLFPTYGLAETALIAQLFTGQQFALPRREGLGSTVLRVTPLIL